MTFRYFYEIKSMDKPPHISIKNATENNLKGISLDLPKHQLIVVTGVSGSGKSSLVFDIIAREGQRRYLQSFSTYARQFAGKMAKPAVDKIAGLSPVIALSQKAGAQNPRSTVGTMSEVYDYLRLLFARFGAAEYTADNFPKIDRSLFSFNTEKGACKTCRGLGLEERVDAAKLIADPSKTLRQGALVPTTPNGYIVYSQITVDVLNTIAEAHGFTVDIPWNEMTSEQQHVVMFGSDKFKVPFGKHSLESRLKWSGITAKPREEGFYGGMIPTMEGILKRDRNKNILRFVSAVRCSACAGTRLRTEALAVKYKGVNIAALAAFSIDELIVWLQDQKHGETAQVIVDKVLERLLLLQKLSLGYLSLEREATTLSGGEIQRIRLAVQVGTQLRGVLYVFDEPSIGLHARDNAAMLSTLRRLVNQGNTVIVVEHDEETMRAADWIVDIGPAAGEAGGELLYNGTAKTFFEANNKVQRLSESATKQFLSGTKAVFGPTKKRAGNGAFLTVEGASENNLQHINVRFPLGCFTAVTGVSGSGKSTLINRILGRYLHRELQGASAVPGAFNNISGAEHLDKVISINQAPIGRTPRSNPATYTGIFDHVRDAFAASDEAKARKYVKGRFSFNNKGGRCETCEGAGVVQIGMHFMGDVATKCADCNGLRFNNETLEIRLHDASISEVLAMRVDEAAAFFADHKALLRMLKALQSVGLGYIKLGQPSTTLSGGEAQRVKLATELQRPSTGKTLYVLDEPTTGLHFADIEVLLTALNTLVEKGNSVIVIEHNIDVIRSADFVVDLGPGSGSAGGTVTGIGAPSDLEKLETPTGLALRKRFAQQSKTVKNPINAFAPILLKGVDTHNLKHIDVAFPLNKTTVVTGVSGSGKSSLVFDTLFAEARGRFMESMGTYQRRLLQKTGRANVAEVQGLTPVVALRQSVLRAHPRSTVGTISEVNDLLRLLFSRVGKHPKDKVFSVGAFSFNGETGACSHCRGLGSRLVADPHKFVSNPDLPLTDGAMNGHKPGKFYGDPYGQHLAILRTAGQANGFDFDQPWNDLSEPARELALNGTGDLNYEVEWQYKNKSREGVQQLSKPWLGLVYYYTEEFERKHDQKGGEPLKPLLSSVECEACAGHRLNPNILQVTLDGHHIAAVSRMTVAASFDWFGQLLQDQLKTDLTAVQTLAAKEIAIEIRQRLETLISLGLGYLSMDRAAGALSGGESQRLLLARQLAADLCGVTYLLDEPTVGLHLKDIEHLLKVVEQIKEKGNTIILVSHNKKVVLCADHLIELGPGAGQQGGQVLSAENTLDLTAQPAIISAMFPVRQNLLENQQKALANKISIRAISGLKINNLGRFIVNFSLGSISVVVGVSGSGKTTLVFECVLPVLRGGAVSSNYELIGLPKNTAVVPIDQRPIVGSSVSTPVTYLAIFDEIRKAFAATDQAKSAGLKKDHFSFNHAKGRCSQCLGKGQQKVSMDFLADMQTICDACNGQRYSETALTARYKGKTIAEAIQMTAAEALILFDALPKVHQKLQALAKVGLDYLPLAQPLNTLSGGELQRLKLAEALAEQQKGQTVFLFDEPTRGLHYKDIARLLDVFHQLTASGHTLIVIEHHPEVILAADHVIELGPNAGPDGGQIVFDGSVAELLADAKTHTGLALAQYCAVE